MSDFALFGLILLTFSMGMWMGFMAQAAITYRWKRVAEGWKETAIAFREVAVKWRAIAEEKEDQADWWKK